ncbi:MAG: hypothetical protein DI596_05215 [Azospira oryzae]|uniref:Formate dehydrogenase n=1 Tax=Pelomicrobium methylotrophicum TaxID=2602750 RepID=A0A5C7EUP2_9PROT|nr:hypothetical protein [Pelomicrobium methylotrophicum]PZP61178.1 MAG: hypothetical protein DI596_05215 [Azospira oryzae]PZP80986.1 MAG: hypothetical protein DI593_05215 [Azospira oryzae]TXF12470.1 hypothetical protein FR698_06375 [Pelomicrobium methylotrophicum]
MKRSMWIAAVASAVLTMGVVGMAEGKLPPPTEEEKAKAEEAKAKAAEAAKKEAEALARVQDAIAERYKRSRGGMAKAGPEAAKPVAAGGTKDVKK